MRETSIDAWREIEQHLSGTRLRAFRLVGAFHGSTASELEQHGNSVHLHKRLSELERGQYVEAGTPRACRVTGKQALTWWIRKQDDVQGTFTLPGLTLRPPMRRKRLEGLLEVVEQFLAGAAGVDLLARAARDARRT